MRTALISDIHGHMEGLLSVLADIEEQDCDRILCLGDLVDGGTSDDEVVSKLRQMGIPSVQGNHDDFNEVPLDPATRRYLRDLPRIIVEDDVLYCHVSPAARARSIDSLDEAYTVFRESQHRLIFTGHLHTAAIFGQVVRHEFVYGRPFFLEPSERYIICVGSASYGRDSLGKLRYAIFDSIQSSVEHRAVEGLLLWRDHTLRKS